MPTISDDFSDPEDLPLEDSLPPPSTSSTSNSNTLSKGKSTASSSIDSGIPLPMEGGGGSGGGGIPKAVKIGSMGQLIKVEADEFQGWDSIYPIYVDTKREQQTGARRVNKEVGLQWPLAEQMAKASRMLGFETVFEPSKTHPKDWANPGRVRVQLKRDGKPINHSIPNKRILLIRICSLLKPHQPTSPSPSTLPSIELRLPPNSPAVSLGTLDSALKGGGPLGMLGNMLGGGNAAGEVEGGGDGDQVGTTPKKKEGPKVIKPKKVHIKRKR